MFKRLVSALPFNPAISSQLIFYAKRLRQEETTRRFAMLFVAAAFALQLFTAVSPAEASVQCSSNDIMYCGGTQAQMASYLQNGRDRSHADLQSIFGYYGISPEALSSGRQTTISTVGSNNFFSVGRTNRDGKDIKVDIWGQETPIFSRRLDVWSRKSWDAVQVTNSRGQRLWVLNDCGNIVSEGHYIPPNPNPNLKIVKVQENKGTVKPGDTLAYEVVYTNTGDPAAFTIIGDDLPSYTTVSKVDARGLVDNPRDPKQAISGAPRPSGVLAWSPNNGFAALPNTGQGFGAVRVEVKVNSDAPNGAQLCNKGYIVSYSDGKTAKIWGESVVCNTVQLLCPDGSPQPIGGECKPPPPPPVTPIAKCVYLKEVGAPSRLEHNFEAKTEVSNASVQSYTFNFGDGSATETVNSNQTIVAKSHTYQKAGLYTATVTAKTTAGEVSSETCSLKVVIASEESDQGLPVASKKARNITQSIVDANNTTANGGDIIEYSLITKNVGQSKIDNYTLMSENIADILEYADLDTNSIGNARFDQQAKTLHWDQKVSINVGEEVVKTFKIKIKNPIPLTPASTSDPKSFDMTLYNVYGNSITIKLPSAPSKEIEKTITTLPNTGPGTGTLISTLFFMLCTYLYMRSRTLRRETEIVKVEYGIGA